MKQTKISLLITVAAVLGFSAILFTSCKKDKVYTTLYYQNNTFTPVYITINGASNTIAAGSTVSFTGQQGSEANGSASTSGTTTSGSALGQTISWTLADNFPASGTQTNEINVSSDFFYLKINNTSPYAISSVYVNFGLTSQTLDYATLPNDGNTYGIGYYDAWTNSNVHLESISHFWDASLSLPLDDNQSYTFYAN